MQKLYLLLADALLVLHALIVLFNVGAVPVIWAGYFRGWKFVRAFSFRATHLLLIGFIAAESVLGAICPLTTWEDSLRTKAGVDPRYPGGYLAYWLHRLLFYDLDERWFILAYGLFFALVVVTWVRVRPRPPRWWRCRD
jgi:polyferredoxin